MWWYRLVSSHSGPGPLVIAHKHGNVLWGSKNGRKFPDQLSNYQLLKKLSFPLN
jgi:hypothetical protein